MTTEHTPTPWDTKPTAGNHQHLIWDETGKTIALVYTDASDAAFICKAINSHHALVEALKDLTAICSIAAPDHDRALARARKALELARCS